MHNRFEAIKRTDAKRTADAETVIITAEKAVQKAAERGKCGFVHLADYSGNKEGKVF